jgi:hypothetical protein
MAISNRDRFGKALDQLRGALLPYISREANAARRIKETSP